MENLALTKNEGGDSGQVSQLRSVESPKTAAEEPVVKHIIEPITHGDAEMIRAELVEAIKPIVEKWGLHHDEMEVQVSKSRHEVDLVFQLCRLNALEQDRWSRQYLDRCHEIDFLPRWLGKEVHLSGQIFCITGLDMERERLRVFNGRCPIWYKFGDNLQQWQSAITKVLDE